MYACTVVSTPWQKLLLPAEEAKPEGLVGDGQAGVSRGEHAGQQARHLQTLVCVCGLQGRRESLTDKGTARGGGGGGFSRGGMGVGGSAEEE